MCRRLLLHGGSDVTVSMPTCSNPHLGCMRPQSQTYGGGSHQVGKLFTFKVKDFTAAADSFQKHQLSVEERSRRLPCNRQVTVQSPSNQSNQKVFLCDFWQPVITWLTAVSVQKHEVQTLCVCCGWSISRTGKET